MKGATPPSLRRFASLVLVGILTVVLAACTGRGGGYLPPGASLGTNVLPQALFPGTVFTGQASFGFSFSCEDKGGVNPPTGQLHIELAYTDHGTSLLVGAPFSIHGIVDKIDPVLESAICIGQNPPPGGNELIFLGRYRQVSGSAGIFPSACPTRETPTSSLCRFEVIVRDNDGDLAPSKGDLFSIKLSGATAVTREIDPPKAFYPRAGFLAGGNLTVR